MTQLSFTVESEVLSKEEIVTLSGASHRAKQLEWLRAKGWKFELTGAGEPIVGRWYARLKLAGVDFSTAAIESARPDFSKVA